MKEGSGSELSAVHDAEREAACVKGTGAELGGVSKAEEGEWENM